MTPPVDPKPNIHYIGVIEEKNSKVVFTKYPIDLPRKLLDKLYAIGEDNDNGSLLALQAEMTNYYPESERKMYYSDYLAPRSYTSSYVDPTHFPRIWTQDEYYSEERKVHDAAEETYAKAVQDRKEQNRPPPPQNREDFVEESVRKWRKDLRNRYLSVAIGFVCSHSYRATISKHQLKDRPDVKMFTTDTIGWTKYIYVINQDITIRFDSNFGYGKRVGYFQLGVSYKGIEIFPYSSYVRYYYANWRTLLRHTRSYEVMRSSWDYALEFVEKHANLALEDPDKFVNEFIIGEVKKMTDGLIGIMNMTQERFSEQMNPDNVKRPRYLGVSVPRNYDIKCYAVYPREMLMAYKAEKITGALAFLGNIKVLSGMLSQVSEYYEIIISLVNQVLPEIKRNIVSIEADMKKLADEKAPLVKELEPLVKEIEKMDSEIAELQANSDAQYKESTESYWGKSDRHQKIRGDYLLAHPLYNQFSSLSSELKSKISRIEKDIRGRMVFLKRLIVCEEVASSAEKFKVILDAIRPHEEAIIKEVADSLSKCDLTKMKPTEIDDVKSTVNLAYTNDHDDFKSLIEKRNEILLKIDGFMLV